MVERERRAEARWLRICNKFCALINWGTHAQLGECLLLRHNEFVVCEYPSSVCKVLAKRLKARSTFASTCISGYSYYSQLTSVCYGAAAASAVCGCSSSPHSFSCHALIVCCCFYYRCCNICWDFVRQVVD